MDGIGLIHLLQPRFFTRYKEFSEQWNLFGQDQDLVEYLRQKQPMSLKLLLQKAPTSIIKKAQMSVLSFFMML